MSTLKFSRLSQVSIIKYTFSEETDKIKEKAESSKDTAKDEKDQNVKLFKFLIPYLLEYKSHFFFNFLRRGLYYQYDLSKYFPMNIRIRI